MPQLPVGYDPPHRSLEASIDLGEVEIGAKVLARHSGLEA